MIKNENLENFLTKFKYKERKTHEGAVIKTLLAETAPHAFLSCYCTNEGIKTCHN